jgi:hypothetical protein
LIKYWFYVNHGSYVSSTDIPSIWDGDVPIEVSYDVFRVAVSEAKYALRESKVELLALQNEAKKVLLERKLILFEKLGLSEDEANELVGLL